MIRYLSVCSGIEAASVAWGPLCWRPVGFAEIDAFPTAVLTHRFPGVPNFCDFTKIKDRADFADIARATNVLIGGTPCQAFSVAGARGGLADERGNLTLQFVRLADAIDAVRSTSGLRPLIIVWENVPGVLSMHDNAFGCFIGALVDGDAPLVPGAKQRWTDAGLAAGPRRSAAWRILDAQFFGVPQRRERVFVVANGGGADPGEILLERYGGSGNTASRGEKATVVAQTITGGARSRGGHSADDLVIAGPLTCSSAGGSGGDEAGVVGRQVFFGGNNCSGPICLSPALTAAAGRYDFETEAFVVYRISGNSGAWPTGKVAATLSTGTDPTDQVIAFALRGRDGGAMAEIHDAGQTVGALRASAGGSSNDYVCVTGSVTHALTAEGHDASEDGTGRGTPIVAAYQCHGTNVGPMGTLRAGNGGLTAGDPFFATAPNAPRRLTPTEKEALQGFPRGWTCVPFGRARVIDNDEVDYLRGQGADVWLGDDGRWITSAAADGPRGKALGNSMAVPVIRWIGERIEEAMR